MSRLRGDAQSAAPDPDPMIEASAAKVACKVAWRNAALCVALLALAAGAFDLFDYDLGLARATGRWIVENAAVPTRNAFSAVNADHPFVDDKWLFHVFAYAVVDGVGPALAVVIRMAILALTFVCVLPRGGTRSSAAFGALLAVLAIVTAHERFAFRPELFSMLFLAILWRRLRDPAPLTNRDVGLLLVMQIAWVNTHGYFVLGPILAAASVAGAWIDSRMRRPGLSGLGRRAILPLLLVLACLVNPYGLELALSPFRILQDLSDFREAFRSTIVEFVPPFGYVERLTFDLRAYRVLLGVVVVALVIGVRRVRLGDLLPLAAFFAMSLDLRRNMATFAIVAAPVAAELLASTVETWRSRDRVVKVTGGVVLAAALGLAFLFLTNRIAVFDRLDRTTGFGESRIANPDLEVDFVLARLPPDGLFNSFTFGSYFVGRAFPERKPFIDGNTAGYPPAFLARYMDAVTGRIPADRLDAWIDELGLRSFLIRPGHPLTRLLLKNDRCVPVFLGRLAVVIVVKDRVDPSVVALDLRPALRDGRFVPVVRTEESLWYRATFPVAEMSQARLEILLDLPERAAASLDRALAIDDTAYEAWHLLGRTQLAAVGPQAALGALTRACEIAPGFAEAWMDRALAASAMRRPAEAEEALDAAVAARGEDVDLALLGARLAIDRGDLKAARAKFERARELAPTDEMKRQIAEQVARLPR